MNAQAIAASAGVLATAAVARRAHWLARDGVPRRRLPSTSVPLWQIPPSSVPNMSLRMPKRVLAMGARVGWGERETDRRFTLVLTAWIVTAFLAGLNFGAGLAVLAAIVFPLAFRSVLTAVERRQTTKLDVSLPLFVDELARSLRTGASLHQALAEAATSLSGRVAQDLRVLVRATDHGMGLSTALEDWADRRRGTGVPLVVTALLVGLDTGGASARAVDGVAMTLRERLAVSAEVRALASQSRLSALVMSLAPLGFCVLLVGADRAAADFLLRSPAGIACLSAGLGLDAIAAVWMSKLSRGEP